VWGAEDFGITFTYLPSAWGLERRVNDSKFWERVGNSRLYILDNKVGLKGLWVWDVAFRA
jgi:hypothetical protein